MTRITQPAGERGSLKWIQRFVNEMPEQIDQPILQGLSGSKKIEWRSPLASDSFAEYRDADFLKLLGLENLSNDLREFWPNLGPQWDALGVSDKGDVLLVEAKAHIDEMCSPGTAAGDKSRAQIRLALDQTIEALEAKPKTDWTDTFYQYANRLAHLHFLRSHGVSAWLVLVGFVGDTDMDGPLDAREWQAAYRVADHVLGIKQRSPLMRFVLHVHPDVRAFTG
jgi:hypothetical protein